ncbi:hypothetical protein [Rosenbergiella gaditana]|uniref:hypothetical protein n=1 Tax=Rosenbergiella gaditana TaxID=2726987 RepID=UPI0030844BD6
MKKCITVSIVLVLTGVALAFGWPYLKMGFASSAYYTERDKAEYEYYTPELLKKCREYLMILDLNLGM